MRTFAAVAFLGLLLVLTGCLGGGLDEDALAENQSYEWDTRATVTVNLTGGSFHAVHEVPNGTPIAVFRDTEFQGEQPVSISAVKFRYPNGTIVGASDIDVEQRGGRTILTPPGDEGQVAYSGNSLPKDFRIAVNQTGSYQVILPRSMRIDVPFMGTIAPGGAELSVRDDRSYLFWESLDGAHIDLSYYLERDFWLFAGLVGLGILAAIGGVLYYRVQIRHLRRRIEEADLGIER
jgi:hypothetical protein